MMEWVSTNIPVNADMWLESHWTGRYPRGASRQKYVRRARDDGKWYVTSKEGKDTVKVAGPFDDIDAAKTAYLVMYAHLFD